MESHHCRDSLFPTSTLIPVTTICILLFVIGITGNTLTILIIQRFKDMKTTTNLYLSSMAISDLVIFFSLPFDLYRLWKYVPWVFGELVCHLTLHQRRMHQRHHPPHHNAQHGALPGHLLSFQSQGCHHQAKGKVCHSGSVGFCPTVRCAGVLPDGCGV